VGRYHSLIVDESSLSDELMVTARTLDATVMALEHVSRPVFGVQFHPESVLTEGGYRLLANFLRLAGCGTQPQEELPTALQTKLQPSPGARPAVPIPY
jgi:para-aminobenzoate synthetase component 2